MCFDGPELNEVHWLYWGPHSHPLLRGVAAPHAKTLLTLN